MCAPSTDTSPKTKSAQSAAAVASTSQPNSQGISKRPADPAVVAPDAEYYAGVIKSYNDRRGFGFLACLDTARRWGRDVYLSKVESQAAIAEGEANLKEGDHVQFAVVLSLEGFPQAIGVQRLQVLKGTVLCCSGAQGGVIACDEARFLGRSEIKVQSSECGSLILHPGDEVSFVLEGSAEDGCLPEARLLQFVSTTRLPSDMLGCFFLEFPRLLMDPRGGHQPTPVDVLFIGHAFGNRICLAGLPPDMGEAELNNFFGKYGAVKVTVAHSTKCGFASVEFSEVVDVARLLTGGAHAFTVDPAITLLARFNRRCGGNPGPTLPALPAPDLLPGEDGALIACWSPVGIAKAYRIEIRAAGAGGWSDVDAQGRVQPAGAAPLLNAQSQCLVISGLCPGVPYEARVSYVTSCGCCAEPSDASAPCLTPVHQPACSPFGASVSQPFRHCGTCALVTQPSASLMVPCSPMSTTLQSSAPLLMPPAPCTPTGAVHSLGSVMMPPNGVASTPTHSLGSVMMPPTPTASTSCTALVPPPLPSPCAHHGSLLQQPCSPSTPIMRQGSGGCCFHGAPLPQPPVLHEVLPVNGNSSALSVQWRSADDFAAGFSVELREGGAKCSERFARPASGLGGILELCIGGLSPGRGYMACVYAVSHCGCESAASTCSSWVTLPGEIEESPSMPCGKIEEDQEPISHETPGVGGKLNLQDPKSPPPEVTGHESDLLLLD